MTGSYRQHAAQVNRRRNEYNNGLARFSNDPLPVIHKTNGIQSPFKQPYEEKKNMTFNPQAHLIKISGKDYLPVSARIVWFREQHPSGSIQTEIIADAAVRATILNQDGIVLASGMATIRSGEGQKWAGRDLEKAETAAIGRAMAHAGFGTQFTGEDEGDFLADSPTGNQHRAGDAWNMTELVKATAFLYTDENGQVNRFEQDASLKKHTTGDNPLIGNITNGAAVELLVRYKTKQAFDRQGAIYDKDSLTAFIDKALDTSLSEWRHSGKPMSEAWECIMDAFKLEFPDDGDVPF